MSDVGRFRGSGRDKKPEVMYEREGGMPVVRPNFGLALDSKRERERERKLVRK